MIVQSSSISLVNVEYKKHTIRTIKQEIRFLCQNKKQKKKTKTNVDDTFINEGPLAVTYMPSPDIN